MGWGSHDTRTKHGQICSPLPRFTSSPDDAEHDRSLRKAACLGPPHHQFSASPLKPGTHDEPSTKASFHPPPNARSLLQCHGRDKPKGSHHRSEPERQRARAATHRLWAGSWPCSVAPARSSPSLGLDLLFPPLVLLPASPSTAQEPHPLFLHPSSEQLPTNPSTSCQIPGPRVCPESSSGGHLGGKDGVNQKEKKECEEHLQYTRKKNVF